MEDLKKLEDGYDAMAAWSGNQGGNMNDNSLVVGGTGNDSQAKLLAATKLLQETQESFNLQYLRL